MAHFAKINDDNIVEEVVVIPDEQEYRGEEYLNQDCNLIGRWLKTSYNTKGGIHKADGIPFRKNYAGIGMIYDEIRDAFIAPKPENGNWILNEDSCIWEEVIEDGS